MLEAPALHPHAVRYAERNVAHNPVQKVLVIVDSAAPTHASIEKAARLALAFGSTLELFSCRVEADLPEAWAGGTTLAAYRGVVRERQIGVLEALAAPLRARGLTVSTECVCTERPADAMIERAIRTHADLVVKDVERHPVRSSAPSMQTDWLLIRAIPSPLLLTRAATWPCHPRICVAVDPCHPAERAATLDEAMIAAGTSFGRALSGAVDLIHTLQSPPHLPGEAVPASAQREAHDHARAAVESLAHRTGIAHEALHFLPERVPDGIVRLADTVGADVIVMGSGGRPRFQYSAATTASLVLDQSSCDVLVVKAPGFVSPVLEE